MKTDRDRSVEQLLRRSIDNPGAPESESCLDAETLAAWIDGGLDDGALMMAEVHAAGCARCQALVGAMARSAPAVPAPAPWWRGEWNLRWLVPLTAGAAAIALWMVVPGDRLGAPPQEQVESRATPDAASPPAAAAVPAPAAPAAPAPNAKLQARTEARERRDAPAAAMTPASKNEARAETATVQRKALVDAVAEVEIASPDAAIRWRLGPEGMVRFSTDGGSTWERQATGVATPLTAGSSPSAAICWLVGRGGVVLVTLDGRRWQRVPFPDAVDLAAVQAADARRAAVTTTDGRTFRTENAGQTWIRVLPQGF